MQLYKRVVKLITAKHQLLLQVKTHLPDSEDIEMGKSTKTDVFNYDKTSYTVDFVENGTSTIGDPHSRYKGCSHTRPDRGAFRKHTVQTKWVGLVVV